MLLFWIVLRFSLQIVLRVSLQIVLRMSSSSGSGLRGGESRFLYASFFLSLFLHIAVRVLRLPAPGICAHVLKILFSSPAEDLPGLGRIGIAGRDIAGTPGIDHIGKLFAAGSGESADNVKDTVADPRTEIEDIDALQFCHASDRADMALRQIDKPVPSGVS